MDTLEMKERNTIFYKKILIVMVAFLLTMSAIGCGVSKSDHEKIVKELEKANQEKASLSDQINQLKAENESLAQKVSNLESDNNTIRQENEDMKAKLASKKSAVKPKAKQKPAGQAKPPKNK
jgi:septal ring factor EnvC (AmiA/AmiB activator)